MMFEKNILEEKIKEIYGILLQFENISKENSNTTEYSYKNYLNRLYVLYVGMDNQDISTYIKGLYNLGASAEHATVKQIVLHIIDILKKG